MRDERKPIVPTQVHVDERRLSYRLEAAEEILQSDSDLSHERLLQLTGPKLEREESLKIPVLRRRTSAVKGKDKKKAKPETSV